MIQIDDIHIEDFRGIRNLHLDLGSESYVVQGANGTGKSGIVDALEFALTGDVSRLKGPGLGDLTLSRHAPHVHRRDNPRFAKVSTTVRVVDTGESATLTRSVETPRRFSLEPDSAAVRAAVEEMEHHPEIVLSRREIIRLIIAEPGKRSRDVQTLLKLSNLSKTRASLKTAKNKLSAGATTSAAAVNDAAVAAERLFDVEEPADDETLKAVNARRASLGVEPLPTLDVERLAEGISTRTQEGGVNRSTALQDIDSLEDEIADESPPQSLAADVAEAAGSVVDDASLLADLAGSQLIDAGLGLLVDEACPLCDHAWPSAEALRSHLESKAEKLRLAGETETAIKEAALALATAVRTAASKIDHVSRVATNLGHVDTARSLTEWKGNIEQTATKLGTVDGTLQIHDQIGSDVLQVPAAMPEALTTLRKAVEALADVSEKVEAASFLAEAKARLGTLQDAQATHQVAQSASDAADAAYERYCEAQDEVLATLYNSVADTFAYYYRAMNSDETGFTVEIEPSAQQLNLSVDFYEEGLFPPAAYHSEGHQDSMGVCLYLALMKHLLGSDFRLAILDDVVMSVDADHRYQFCELLKREFPDVQFIVTTHDAVWAHQMVRSNLVSRSNVARLDWWDVHHGPWLATGTDFWEFVDEALHRNSVPEAGWRLRHNLERVLADLADEYRCPIPYRADGRYNLSEYRDAIKRRYSRLLRKAAGAANSRNDTDAASRIEEMKTTWSEVTLAQDAGEWMVNRAVHYTEWADFSKSDFQPIVDAWKELLDVFECPECQSRLYVTERRGVDDTLKCSCGHLNLNLRERD